MQFTRRLTLTIPSLNCKPALLAAALAFAFAPAANAASAVCFKAQPLQAVSFFSNFGLRPHPFKADPKTGQKPWLKMHEGIDLTAHFVPMYAVDDGVVVLNPTFSDGIKALYLNTDSGVQVRYEHITESYIKPGTAVKAGQLIGKTGNTGAPMGPHLHFEVRLNGGSTPVDPKMYFCPSPPAGAAMTTTYFPGQPANVPVPMSYPGTGGSTTAPPGGPPNPGAPASGGGGGTPGAGGSLAGGGIPPGAPFPDYIGVSTEDFFSQEVSKRFLNPTWMRDLLDPNARLMDPDYIAAHPEEAGKPIPPVNSTMMLVREIAIMTGLSNMMTMETAQSKENVQSMLSTLLQIRAKDKADSALKQSRDGATSPSKGN